MVSVVGTEVIGGESVSGAGIIAGKFTEGVTHSAINSSGTLRSKDVETSSDSSFLTIASTVKFTPHLLKHIFCLIQLLYIV